MDRFLIGISLVFGAFAFLLWGDLILAIIPWVIVGAGVIGAIALVALRMDGRVDGGSFAIVVILATALIFGGCAGLGMGGGKVMIASTDNSYTQIDNSRTLCFFGNCRR